MKYVLIALTLVLSQFAAADAFDAQFSDNNTQYTPSCSLVADCDDDDDDEGSIAWACGAKDRNGRVYKYYLHWHDVNYVQRQAMKKCKANSNNPASCRPMGCSRIN